MKTGLIDAGETPLVMNPTSKFYIICSSTISATRDSPEVASQQKTPLFSTSQQSGIRDSTTCRRTYPPSNLDCNIFLGIASTTSTFHFVHMVDFPPCEWAVHSRCGGQETSMALGQNQPPPACTTRVKQYCFHRQAVSCRLGARPDQVETGIRNAGPPHRALLKGPGPGPMSSYPSIRTTSGSALIPSSASDGAAREQLLPSQPAATHTHTTHPSVFLLLPYLLTMHWRCNGRYISIAGSILHTPNSPQSEISSRVV